MLTGGTQWSVSIRNPETVSINSRWIRTGSNGPRSSPSSTGLRRDPKPNRRHVGGVGGLPGVRRSSARRADGVEDSGRSSGTGGGSWGGLNRLVDLRAVAAELRRIGGLRAAMWSWWCSGRLSERRGARWCEKIARWRASYIGSTEWPLLTVRSPTGCSFREASRLARWRGRASMRW